MPPLPHPVNLLASPEDVETQFYEALREGSIDRVMAVWADDDEVVCVHPAGGRVFGPQAVRATFEAIFSHGAIPVHAEHVHRVQSMGTSVHSVLERVDLVTSEGTRTGWVTATNVYVKTAQGWRMVAHHASPGTADAPRLASEAPATLH
jgi:ketosteroid isomerase-like protein